MEKETEQGKAARTQWTSRVMEILGERQVVAAGRWVVVERVYRPRTVFKMLGYDFAILRVETTGCRFGYFQPEDRNELYYEDEGGKEEFILLSDVRAISPHHAPLVTQSKSIERIQAQYDRLCQNRFCDREICFHCQLAPDHTGAHQYFQPKQHHIDVLPGQWPGRPA